ncbi:hypothetical protein [Streptomyces sp. NPDC002758]
MAATRPKGVSGRASALVGAGMALSLALAAQVTAHLIASGYMGTSAFLVAATSAVPPVVVAHLLHLAAAPRAASEPLMAASTDTTAGKSVGAPQTAAESPAERVIPDDLWQDFEKSAPDSVESVANDDRPNTDIIRSAVAALSAAGQRVTGAELARYFGVSERTGRRYLAMAA